MAAKQEQKSRARAFHRQKGKCWWCKKPMRANWQHTRHASPPADLCTLEHLDDRWDPDRGKRTHLGRRRVAACWQCNWQRGRDRQAAHKAEARAKSGAYPTPADRKCRRIDSPLYTDIQPA